jgi:hypothetical protein
MSGSARGRRRVLRLMKEGIPLETLLRYGLHGLSCRVRRGKPKDLETFAFEHGEEFFTRHLRPRAPHALLLERHVADHSDTAIVIQGPIGTNANFVRDTASFYRLAFGGARIILSTWDTEDPLVLSSLEALVDDLVLSALPPNPGLSNGNFQLVSAQAGLQRAKSSGVPYAIKTRTDQRIYEPSAISMLKCLLAAFPPDSKGLDITGRLIVSSLDTFKYRMYGLSDQFMFGWIGDVERYWSSPLDSRRGYDEIGDLGSLRSYAQSKICEVAFATHFLSSIGWELKWTLLDYWSSLAAAFVVVDASSLDLLWPKYSSSEYRWRRYTRPDPFEEMSFAKWSELRLLKFTEEASSLEPLLDLPLSEPWGRSVLQRVLA